MTLTVCDLVVYFMLNYEEHIQNRNSYITNFEHLSLIFATDTYFWKPKPICRNHHGIDIMEVNLCNCHDIQFRSHRPALFHSSVNASMTIFIDVDMVTNCGVSSLMSRWRVEPLGSGLTWSALAREPSRWRTPTSSSRGPAPSTRCVVQTLCRCDPEPHDPVFIVFTVHTFSTLFLCHGFVLRVCSACVCVCRFY